MHYDVCIVGSGAGAGPVAYTLSEAGFSVLILEKGPWYKRKDFFKDEVGVCRRSSFTPRLDLEQHVIEEKTADGWEGTPTADSGWDFWNGNMVGGSSNLMSGYFHRMKAKDFSLATSYPKVEGSNIVDWPIDYAIMEPYYAKVESIVGVSGRVVDHAFQEERSTKDFPYPPTIEHGITKWFDRACENLNIQAIPTPRAVLSQSVDERNGCEYAGYCGSYGCASGAKGSAREALLNKALATGKLTIIPHAFVKRLHEHQGEVVKAEYVDKEGKTHYAKARLFVVAAQAIETSRLLLNSRSEDFPNGLSNNHGQVGKNLVFSAGGTGSGVFYYDELSVDDAQALKEVGPFVNRSLQTWYEVNREGKTYKGGTIDFLFEHPNAISKARRAMYEGDLVWRNALKQRLLQRFTAQRVFTYEVFCDWSPNDDCFVTLDPELKDQWGMPVAKVRIGALEHDLTIGEALAKEANKVLEQMGAKEVSSSISDLPPQNLQAGGCRFGHDPRTSVLDENCCSHEVRNLYVSDGSFMPTGGSVPFTWTIYANAFRVADAIVDRLKGT